MAERRLPLEYGLREACRIYALRLWRLLVVSLIGLWAIVALALALAGR